MNRSLDTNPYYDLITKTDTFLWMLTIDMFIFIEPILFIFFHHECYCNVYYTWWCVTYGYVVWVIKVDVIPLFVDHIEGLINSSIQDGIKVSFNSRCISQTPRWDHMSYVCYVCTYSNIFVNYFLVKLRLCFFDIVVKILAKIKFGNC